MQELVSPGRDQTANGDVAENRPQSPPVASVLRASSPPGPDIRQPAVGKDINDLQLFHAPHRNFTVLVCSCPKSFQYDHLFLGADAGTAPPTGDIANLLHNVTQQHSAEEADDDEEFQDTTQHTPFDSPIASVTQGLDVNNSAATSTAGDELQDSQDEGTTRRNETRQQRFHLKSVGMCIDNNICPRYHAIKQ